MPCLRPCIALALACVGICVPRAARADNPRARLVYTKGVDTESCPDADGLKDGVRQRLGYDPFDDGAEQTIDATLKREKRGYVTTLAILLRDGTRRERQPLSSTSSECGEVATSLALAISIAIDPHSFTRAALQAPPPPVPPPVMASTEPAPAPASPTKTEGAHLGWRVGAGPMMSLGALPTVSAGPMVLFGATLANAALQLEGRYDFPSSAEAASGGTAKASLLLGSVVPCFEPKPLVVCGIASTGLLFGRGEDLKRPRSDTTSYSAVGARIGLDVALFLPLRGRLQLEGNVPLRPTALRVAGVEVWQTPPAFATLSFVFYGYGPR